MPARFALLSQLYRLTSPPADDAELLHRWVEQRDEDAFSSLVSRHGRMVHGVCRRILGNRHDAEDAYQAVFLILARKADAIRRPEALAGWLHGVAVRLAYKARAAAARRRITGADSSSEPPDPHPDPLDVLSARELLALIDQEIARLPEVYRLPLVLCDLEDRTQAEAAGLLGWTLGSFRGRLLRGRERLRTRLARRGLAPAVLATAFVQGTADAAALTASISRLAVRFSSCPSSVEISPPVAALVGEGIRGTMLTKLKLVSAVMLAASTFVAGAGLLAWPTSSPSPKEERAENKPPVPPTKPQVRRDRAGDPLPDEALSRLGTIRLRHGGLIEYLAFGPDGKLLISCGLDGIRFWDVASGKEVQRFPDQSRAGSIALSSDGKMLAVRVNTDNTDDESIAIREFASGRLLRRFGDARTPHDLLFSPDGKVLGSYGWDRPIELWEPSSGRRLHTLKGHKDRVWSLAFSADSKMLVSSSDDKTIRFWDMATGKELRQIKHHQGIGPIAWSPDGELLASIDIFLHEDKEYGSGFWSNDNHVRLWNASTGKQLRQLSMPTKKRTLVPEMKTGFRSLRFAPDGKMLLTGGDDGILRIWDPVIGKELRQFPGFAICPGPFAFAPDRKSLAVVDGLQTVRLLDLASGKDRLPPLGHRARVSSISVPSDGQAIATIGQDGTLRFWEPMTGRELRRRAVSVDYSQSCGLRPDRRTYLTVGPDKVYHVHDLASGKERTILRGHESPFPFALSPDGKTLASANADKVVRLLDPASGELRHTLTEVKHYVTGMSFTADGRIFVMWDEDRIVTVWDVATGKKRRQFTGPRASGEPFTAGGPMSPYTAVLSPDGKLLAFGLQGPDDQAGILPVVDTTTGKEVRRFSTAASGAEQMAFSPDGKSLAWSGWYGESIYLGEIVTGRERRRFVGHTGCVFSLAFSPDGKMLISGSQDTTALVWDLTGRLTMGKKFGKPLSAEDLKTHWKTLAADDAAAGYRAVQGLAADPARSVPYLRAHLHPIAPADEKHLQQWIVDLDSEQFAVRAKASSELEKLGAGALHAMRKTLEEKPPLEKRRRLEQLIEKQEREEWSPSAENLRTRRVVEVLERAGTAEAKEVLRILANGAPGAWQTLDARAALQRLTQRPAGK